MEGNKKELPLEVRLILPIPREFDDMPEDIYPIEGGWFRCMMCFAPLAKDWQKLAHDDWCQYARPLAPGEHFTTHGEVRAGLLFDKPTP